MASSAASCCADSVAFIAFVLGEDAKYTAVGKPLLFDVLEKHVQVA